MDLFAYQGRVSGHACSDFVAVLQVQGALKALYKIQSCADLFKVAEHHPEFDQELHQEIFAADQVECMLLVSTVKTA